MEHQNIALTLGVGVLISSALFFFFHKTLKRPGKLSSLLTILVVQAIYIPLAATHWVGLDVFAIHFAFYTMTAVLLGVVVGSREGKTGGGGFHWGHGIIVGFFMILVMVDSTIITLANSGASADFIRRFLPDPQRESAKNVVSAFPGTVSHNFDKKYDLYNNYIAQLKTQKERGWKIGDGWLEKPVLGKTSLFRIQISDRDGQAVTGGKVVVSFLRPSDNKLDVQLELPESAPGHYGLPVQLPAPGMWGMVITVTRGEEVHEIKGETWVEEKP
ncbi:MAG: FixH family protein [Gammaproteobacteria bacterium]|nr:FixH family protein [Gammaproteobacteria bacterium]MBU1724023.1 FixH family protein [Gammaproteobacteria bacterium]MBU2006908.1 FixH family protein [Gammaproteobacteria bacterium]